MIRRPIAIPDMGRLRGSSGLGPEAFPAKSDEVSREFGDTSWSPTKYIDGKLARFVLFSGCEKNATASNG